MKIVYLAAGAAGMYCGSCLHDNTLAAALLALGEDVLLVPTYTPLRTDEENVSSSHLFFGGINVYLQQHSALFRHTPWFLDAVLNNPRVLNWATRGGPSLEAEKLGDLTVSMLQGEHGKQRKEIKKLVHWLSEARPDVVHLSNAMLLGMAREIRRLGIPVVCSLSGEDVFLERLPAPYYRQARETLRERAADATWFVAFNQYYADLMTDYLDMAAHRIQVIPHGLNLAGHGPRARSNQGVFSIGYLARICPDKGLHNLIDAAEALAGDPGVPPFRIRAAGYLSKGDRAYLAAIQERVKTWPDPGRFEYVGEVDRAGKIEFLQSLDAFCLPTDYRESKGISVLEAMANGVPVVLPDHGAFSELVRASDGGRLYAPGDRNALAGTLREWILDRPAAAELGTRGRRHIERENHAPLMARRHQELYAKVVSPSAPHATPASS